MLRVLTVAAWSGAACLVTCWFQSRFGITVPNLEKSAQRLSFPRADRQRLAPALPGGAGRRWGGSRYRAAPVPTPGAAQRGLADGINGVDGAVGVNGAGRELPACGPLQPSQHRTR